MGNPIGIENLTEQDRASAKLALSSWESKSSVSKLFKLFHKYVAKEPSNESCGICRRTIKTFWTNYLK